MEKRTYRFPSRYCSLTSGSTSFEVIWIKIFKEKNRSLSELVSLVHYDKIMNIQLVQIILCFCHLRHVETKNVQSLRRGEETKILYSRSRTRFSRLPALLMWGMGAGFEPLVRNLFWCWGDSLSIMLHFRHLMSWLLSLASHYGWNFAFDNHRLGRVAVPLDVCCCSYCIAGMLHAALLPLLVCGRGTVNAGMFITIQQHFHLRFVMEFAGSYRTILT